MDLTADEPAVSVLVQNAMVLLGEVAKGDGVVLTARENLARRTVAAMRHAMVWPGCRFEETWRAGQSPERGPRARAAVSCRRWSRWTGRRSMQAADYGPPPTGCPVHKDRWSRLQANLFSNTVWQMSLNLFGNGECGHWPQRQIGMAL